MLPPLDVAEPEEFIAATVQIFAHYPVEVMQGAVHPVRGIPGRTDRPTLKIIKAVCDELYAPILADIERRRAIESHQRALPPAREQRTPEQQARIDAMVEDARKKLGAPLRKGIPPLSWDGHGPPPSRPDGRHYDRIKDDLEARRTRNEQRAPQ